MSETQCFNDKLDYTRSRTSLKVAIGRFSFYGFLLSVSDYFSILIIPAIACFFAPAQENLRENIFFWFLLAAATIALAASHKCYRKDSLTNINKSAELTIRCYLATSITMLSVALLMGHTHAVSRYWTTAELCLTPIVLMLMRTIGPFRIGQTSTLRVSNGPLIVCFDRCPRNFTGALAEQQIFEAIAGVLYLSSHHNDAGDSSWPVIPDIKTFLEIIQTKDIQNIIFICQSELELISAELRKELLSDLLVYPARIWLAFNLEPQLPHMLTNRAEHYKLVPVVTDNLVNSLNLTKRFFDLIFAVLLLVLALPVLGIIAALVRASGPGPVIFRQIRSGAHGHRFTVLKFRTMSHVANAPFAQATKNDPRVTPIGRFLRRSSLDELLQLINVLKGDMSLVGPRPHAPETQIQGMTFEDAVRLYRLRYRVKPGITGLAQIRGQRGETRMIELLEQRTSSDLEYIERWSIWLDISILFRTLPILIKQKNAY